MKLGKHIEGKTILITGGAGSFGHQITERLLKCPETKIIVFSRDEDKHRIMDSKFDSDRVSFKLGDIRDYDRVLESFNGVDIVLHAGALKQIPSVEYSPMEAVKTNVLGGYNVAKACEKQNVEMCVGISTDKACMPINTYGLSKALMEKIFVGDDVWSDLTKFGCVRYGNVLGSRGSVLPVWDKLIDEGKPIPITSKKMRRFFITYEQACDLILYATDNIVDREIFVRKAPALFISDLAQVYAELKTGKKNYPQKEIGIRDGEKLDEVLISAIEMQRAKTKKGNYVEITRKNGTHKHQSNYEYSSATTEQLDKTKIKKLIEGLKWRN